ncbi:hypothetical protein H6G81_01715 [Scytonema hofmannii FACHB-248]|uniref:Uncharacterized protein n=1 Tax=Scytonema hofmannii FACHB-248 TaxID=1842502 RepID=A0ABR8GIW4_9CYAN|nr:hypothetical protein [Scytonema hofmannii]MBD2603273.1 hypothetical protein [Scytonema hofmannii FACHB-248]
MADSDLCDKAQLLVVGDRHFAIYRKNGFKAPSLYDGFQLISVPIHYTNNSGKVINHLKNLAVERQSTEP